MRPKPLRHTLIPAALLAAPWLLLLAGGRPAWTDDRELLRFRSAKPFLFILLDTSSSMNLSFGDDAQPLQGDGDNPLSRIYGAKEALFEVFQEEDNIHYGFAAFNQDDVAVTAKHWLYFTTQKLDEVTGDDGSPVAGDWPLDDYPLPPAGNRITEIAGGSVRYLEDHGGDLLTFGPRLRTLPAPGAAVDSGTLIPGGSCGEPLPLGAPGSEERMRVNRFARQLGPPGQTENPNVTEIWLRHQGTGPARTYRMTFRRAPGKPQDNSVGASELRVRLRLQRLSTALNACPNDFDDTWDLEVVLARDPNLSQYVMVDGLPPEDDASLNNQDEAIPGLWPESFGGVVARNTCGGDRTPHSGGGIEPNHDSEQDQFCIGSTCVPMDRGIRPMRESVPHDDFATLNRGDFLPISWERNQLPHRRDFLQRLAPSWDPDDPTSTPHFGVAFHLQDAPQPGTGAHRSRLPWRPPLVAAGESPINKAVLDFRCWVQLDGNKCKKSPHTESWVDTACSADQDWGCRRTYFIVISDGGNTCRGEDPSSDTAGMWNSYNIRTWALNLGPTRNCRSGAGGALHSITRNSGPGGEARCINIESKENLKEQLRRLRGIIREEARAFASAAVPSVQAVADQAIYLTNFTPLNDQPIWPGRVDAYVKPLPLTPDGKPDRDHENHVWDAGDVIVAEQYNATTPVGETANQRRVYFGRASQAGGWSGARSLLWLPPSADGVDEDEEWYDLWRGFALIPSDAATGSLEEEDEERLKEDLESILFGPAPAEGILRLRTAEIEGGDGLPESLSYLMGDVFHSDPLVLGQPVNTTYLNLDLHGDPSRTCEHRDPGTAAFTGDRGYRCFFARHRYRRQVLLVGANDGMLHAFNLAQFRKPANEAGRYDHGTGHEVFAYMPRSVMPTVRDQVRSDRHFYSVDGSPAAADVFIDPLWDGTSPPNQDRRMWRTVVITGLREGGRALFALDATQPDRLRDEVHLGGFLPQNAGTHLPTCMGAGHNADDCGPLPYPSPLWEFTDSHLNSDLVGLEPEVTAHAPLRMAENLRCEADPEDCYSDLGDAWSTPMIGRIRICGNPGGDCTDLEPGDLEDRYVAIFGGGMDPEHKPDARSGDWLYMVDVETGYVLYKRQLLNPHDGTTSAGSAPSQVAALDINGNGYLDRLYLGTTGGFLYRVDLHDPTHPYPGLETVMVNAIDRNANSHALQARRIARTHSDGTPAWEPRAIFDANWEEDGSPAPGTRSIFFRTAVIVAQNEGGLVLGFGTGDREDLWSPTPSEGRFYMIMDESGLVDPSDLPFTDADYVRIEKGGEANPDENFLFQPPLGKRRGWFLALDPAERVISDSFSFLGIVFFASYRPQVGLTDENGDPIEDNANCVGDGEPFACCTGAGTGSCGERYGCGGKQNPNQAEPFCSRTGISELFLVSALNADPLYPDLEDEEGRVRSRQVGTFVTTPYSEFTRGALGSDATAGTADELTAADAALMEFLKTLFPPGCRFINARIDVHTIASDTRVEKLTSVPVCMQTTGWKEF